MGITESPSNTETVLNRIAWLSERDKNKEFGSLMHLFNSESLKQCFRQLDKNKAVGIDGINKEAYEKNLDHNIEDLLKRMKNMAYIPGTVRQVLIPKEGKPGATRPLGISNLEDKIVQSMMKRVLESIYEPCFLECSYGFRPGRGCHTAIEALMKHLYKNEIQTVIDVDLGNFFGTIDHQLLEGILKERIKDPKLIRYINRMFKAGVLAEGELTVSEEGISQGSICSPILANIFAHHVIDIWVEKEAKPCCKGKVAAFRYADDIVICCEYEEDAIHIRETLGKRLTKFKLQLNEDKTKLIPFDKKKENQGTFDFLGFTFYWGHSRKMRVIPKLKTRGKTIRTKLNKVKQWIKQERNRRPLKEIWKSFCSKMRGHVQYYGVSHNARSVNLFLHTSKHIIFKWLNRRSQKKSFNWEQFILFILKNPMPSAKIVHRLF